jgi:hypothetical protein
LAPPEAFQAYEDDHPDTVVQRGSAVTTSLSRG